MARLTTNPFNLLAAVLKTVYMLRATIDADKLAFAFTIPAQILRIELIGQDLPPMELCSTDIETWMSDLSMFVSEGPAAMGYRDRFFRKICAPAMMAFELSRDIQNPHRNLAALAAIKNMTDCDWKVALTQWLNQQPESKVVNESASQG